MNDYNNQQIQYPATMLVQNTDEPDEVMELYGLPPDLRDDYDYNRMSPLYGMPNEDFEMGDDYHEEEISHGPDDLLMGVLTGGVGILAIREYIGFLRKKKKK